MEARYGLARAKVDVDRVVVSGRVGSAAYVHLELRNVVGPVLGSDLRVGLDAILVRFVYGVGMVFAGLDKLILGGGEMLDNAGDELFIVVNGGEARVFLLNGVGGVCWCWCWCRCLRGRGTGSITGLRDELATAIFCNAGLGDPMVAGSRAPFSVASRGEWVTSRRRAHRIPSSARGEPSASFALSQASCSKRAADKVLVSRCGGAGGDMTGRRQLVVECGAKDGGWGVLYGALG